jgi:Tfp pilus assembly protein PilF
MAENDEKSAEQQLWHALETSPNDVDLLIACAKFLISRKQDLVGADRLLLQAIAVDQHAPEPLLEYARFLELSRHDMALAEKYYRLAVAADPDDTTARTQMGSFLAHRKSALAEAERHFQHAIRKSPRSAPVRVAFAWFLETWRKDRHRAKAEYQFAANAMPEEPLFSAVYGYFVGIDLRKAAEGRRLLSEAVKRAPNDPGVLTNCAAALFLWGETSRAYELVQTALANRTITDERRLEVNFYLAAYVRTAWPTALTEMRRLLSAGVRLEGSQFSSELKFARNARHPTYRLLERLAEVIADDVQVDVLEKFPEWRNSTPGSLAERPLERVTAH